jgi:hypothetical protein
MYAKTSVETVVIPSIAGSQMEQAVILEIMYAKTSVETVVIPSIAASQIERAVILEIMYGVKAITIRWKYNDITLFCLMRQKSLSNLFHNL